MEENNDVMLKATDYGVDIYLDNRHENEELYRIYGDFLKEKDDYFKDNVPSTIKLIANYFSEEQRERLIAITKEKINGVNVDFMTMEDFRSHPLVRKEERKFKRRTSTNYEEPKACHKERDFPTKYVEGTVRSGDTVEYDGNIVVVGDVNAGAVIKAKGSIFVLGALRGTAYAGCAGDETAYVYALCMMPLQIRIAYNIAKSPDGKQKAAIRPEIAKISGEFITIESAFNI